MSAQWFSDEGLPPQSAFEVAFLGRLRARAAAWQTDVRPSDTQCETIEGEVLVGIGVPGLSGRMTMLWLECVEDHRGTPSLEGSWGDPELVADHYGGDPLRDLTVTGVPASPEVLADLAGQWCEHHLRMDIVREEWARGRWNHRDAIGARYGRKRGTPIRAVPERISGRATGRHLI